MLNRAILVAVTATLGAVLAACGGGDSAPRAGGEAGEPRYGGTAVVSMPSDIQSINPLTSSDNASSQIQEALLFVPLLRMGPDLQVQPGLAESWDTMRVAPDTLEVTFHLRDDVRWHDGEPTTAEDVRFTFERAIDPSTAYPNRTQFDRWSPHVEVVDDHTVRFRVRPHADFLTIWNLPMLPSHILGDVPSSGLALHPFSTSEPVGNGPFRFVRRLPNQEWVFDANEDFPEGLGGRPYLDRIVFRVIPEGNTRLTELLTGGIDVYPDPTPSQTPQIESSPDVSLISAPHTAYTYVGWNERNPMFADARVRRALSMAINRQQLVEALLYGHGAAGVSTSTPAHWSYEVQSRLAAPYDPEQSRRLLAEAGWRDRDGDGIVENEAGQPFRFDLVTNQGSDLRHDAGEVIQAQLRSIGVDARFRSIEWNTLIGMLDGSLNAEGERVRDFDAVISGWVNGVRKDDAPILHSRNLNDPYQETGFSNPRVDALLDTLPLIVDRDEAAPMWEEYHRLLLEESPYAVLFYPNIRVAFRNRIHGVVADARGNLISAAAWWIEQ